LEVLRLCFPANLRRTLKELPKSLDETYKRILNEINNANYVHAYRLLQCLAVALRPLRVEELAEVLAFDLAAGGIPKLHTDWRWEDQEEAVLSACSSLVSVITDDGSRVVQFSHFSVKEFLTSDRLAGCREEVSQFHIPIEPSHAILAQACLGVFLCLDDHTDKDSTKNIPLYRYAVEYWVEHTRVGNVELQMKDALDYLFDMDNPHFPALARIEHHGDLLRVSVDEEPTGVPRSAAPLYFAAWRGFHGLVGRLIIKDPQQVTQLGGIYGTPLHASVLGGHIEVSQLLFTHGADINSRCADNWTPLHDASGLGHVKIAKWLLKHGADVNSRENGGQTPLYYAASKGQLETCQILLEHNAEIDSQDNDGLTPFLISLEKGHRDVVRLLINHNADVCVRNTKGNTPLHVAASYGYLEVCRILLERNAEVDSRNNNGSTPFLRALQCGHLDVAHLLLDNIADVRVHDTDGNTPLHVAASNGCLEVCRILFEHNAEVDSRNNDGLTPFHGAWKNETNPDILQLFLEHGADMDVYDTDQGNTPLHIAAENGLLEVARQLLERNVEVDPQNIHDATPFLAALANGHSDVARLLLEHNADMHVHDIKGNTPLHFAAENGLLEVAQILLGRNAEVDSKNNHGSTSLLLASEFGHPDVVQLLLDHNADLYLHDADGGTPLHYAAIGGQLEVARILLKLNVEVNSRNVKGSTPLHLASMGSWERPEGSAIVVRLLLEYGADVQVRDLNRKTASDVARGPEQEEIVRLLSERAAAEPMNDTAPSVLDLSTSVSDDCAFLLSIDSHHTDSQEPITNIYGEIDRVSV
jgi:ankyrin repeat protein